MEEEERESIINMLIENLKIEYSKSTKTLVQTILDFYRNNNM